MNPLRIFILSMVRNKEQYKKEYNDFFECAFRRYYLAFSKPGLYESNKVAEGMEDVATEIGNIAKKFITEIIENIPLTPEQETPFDIKNNHIHTRFSFDKDYKNNMLESLKKGEIPSPILLDGTGYPIDIQFEDNTEKPTVTAQIPWRNKDDDSFGTIIVSINLYQYLRGIDNINNSNIYSSLVSSIAHGLQHAFDIYILPHCNPHDTNKIASIMLDFGDDTFGLKNKPEFILVSQLLYMMEPEEVNTRLAELKMVLKILSENKDLANAMFYESFMDRKSGIKFVSQDYTILESALMRDVADNKVLQVVTRVDLFYNAIKQLLVYKVDSPLHYNAIILIIGYYMYRHNLIKMPDNKTQKSIIRKYLSDVNRLKKIIDLEHIAANIMPVMNFITETIFLSIKNQFYQYFSNVHDIITEKFLHLYNYKRLDEVFDEVISLYPDEVFLYPVQMQKEMGYMDYHNGMFKFCYENYPLAFAEKCSNEAMHVIDKADEATQSLIIIFKEIMRNVEKESGTDIAEAYKTIETVYTGFNFNKDYKQKLLSELENGNVPEPVTKVDDESAGYPIYIKTEWFPSEKHIGVYAWVSITDSEMTSRIIVHMNVAKFQSMMNVYRAHCLLAMEITEGLQHTIDSFIIPHSVELKSDLCERDEFELTEHSEMIYRLLSMICPVEINTRLVELKSVLDIISSKPVLANAIFYERVMSKSVMSPPLALDYPLKHIYESELFGNVGRNSLFRSISRIDIYKHDIDEIIKMRVENPEKYNVVMLILGFYLFKHNLLFLTGTADEKKSIRKLLGNKDNIMKVIDLETMSCRLNKQYDFIIETVYESVRKHFAKYVGEVHYRIESYLPYLYNYKKVDGVLESSEIYDAVILYPVV